MSLTARLGSFFLLEKAVYARQPSAYADRRPERTWHKKREKIDEKLTRGDSYDRH